MGIWHWIFRMCTLHPSDKIQKARKIYINILFLNLFSNTVKGVGKYPKYRYNVYFNFINHANCMHFSAMLQCIEVVSPNIPKPLDEYCIHSPHRCRALNNSE